jgi:hypothetical protein
VSLLDPAGRMRDLLKECNNGEHPATRYELSPLPGVPATLPLTLLCCALM